MTVNRGSRMKRNADSEKSGDVEVTKKTVAAKRSKHKIAAPGERQRIVPGFAITVSEAMRDCVLSYPAVLNLIKRGDFRAGRGNGGFRISTESICDWLNGRTANAKKED